MAMYEAAARLILTSHRHEGEPRRDRRDVGICVALGISIIGLAAGVPTRVLGSQPSKVGQAQDRGDSGKRARTDVVCVAAQTSRAG